MGVIFFLSTTAGAASNSSYLLDSLLGRFTPRWYLTLNAVQKDALDFYLRKTAHVTEYAVLGVLMARALRRGRSLPFPGFLLLGWLFATVYAATDEFHQSFVPGRTPKVTDVALDSCGAALGTVLYALLLRRRAR